MASSSLPSNHPKLVTYFWERVEKTPTCWLWLGSLTNKGYGTFMFKGKRTLAHRYSFFLHNGYSPEPMCLHSCDNPPCVNPDHLRAGTSADNARDAMDRGRYPIANLIKIGHPLSTAKLTEDQVREIREIYARGGISTHKLAKMFGMTPTPIKRIIRGETWKQVI